MAKTEDTLQLEKDIKVATLKMGVFGCLEVTIGFGGKERVDYMTYDTKGIFRCYEIKVSKSDFHSKHKNSFVGHYNYYVLTQELYNQVSEEIPDYVGVYVGQSCVKKPKKQDIDSKMFTFRRSVDGRSTEISVPWTDMLKDSIIRSLYRDSQKLHRSKNKDYINRVRNQLANFERIALEYKTKYFTLYRNFCKLFGKNLTHLLDDVDFEERVNSEKTLHQDILMMNKRDLAKFLHSYQTKNCSIREIELSLNKTQKELNEDNGTEQ